MVDVATNTSSVPEFFKSCCARPGIVMQQKIFSDVIFASVRRKPQSEGSDNEVAIQNQ